MKVALGIKAHSGWAALVTLGEHDGELLLVDRRRIELVENEWAKQPYHAAEHLEPEAACDLVARGIEAAIRLSLREMRAAVKRERDRNNEVDACAVLVADPMPDWSIDEILAVHFRMHKAEGVLFKDALAHAATECGLRLVAIQEKQLAQGAERALGTRLGGLAEQMAALGKSAGPPWGKDQKDAVLAALIAMHGNLSEAPTPRIV